MSIEFRHPTLEDRGWITDLYHRTDSRSCENSFVNLYLWGRGYGEIARVDDWLLQYIKFNGTKYYAYPAGGGSLRTAIDALIADAHEHGHPMRMLGVTCDRREEMEALYPGKFTFEEDRAAFDYLYEIDRLADLGGRKLSSKRNHCNRFEALYPDWSTEPITKENLPVCRKLAEKWFSIDRGEVSEAHDFQIERIALARAFDDFGPLGLEGLILSDGEKPVAFTMGNLIQEDTFDVNFEKAFADVPGSYPVINRECARYVREKYPQVRYLNREDDMGLPGLRSAKESYRPDILLCKGIATL